jgi:hypothetical protein
MNWKSCARLRMRWIAACAWSHLALPEGARPLAGACGPMPYSGAFLAIPMGCGHFVLSFRRASPFGSR